MVRFRAHGQSSLDKTRRAIESIGGDGEMREEMQRLIRNFLSQVNCFAKHVPDELKEPLTRVSDFTAKARSHVQRDRRGDLQYLPRPEVGTRLGKELGKLLLALAAVRGTPEPDQADFATVCRVADDCIPPNRLAVIQALRREPMQATEIQEASNLPNKTVHRVLDDLRVLEIVTGEGHPGNLVWRLLTD